MNTMPDVNRERRANEHRRRNSRPLTEVMAEACERALDALKHGDLKLVEREVEYVKEKLEKVA